MTHLIVEHDDCGFQSRIRVPMATVWILSHCLKVVLTVAYMSGRVFLYFESLSCLTHNTCPYMCSEEPLWSCLSVADCSVWNGFFSLLVGNENTIFKDGIVAIPELTVQEWCSVCLNVIRKHQWCLSVKTIMCLHALLVVQLCKLHQLFGFFFCLLSDCQREGERRREHLASRILTLSELSLSCPLALAMYYLAGPTMSLIDLISAIGMCGLLSSGLLIVWYLNLRVVVSGSFSPLQSFRWRGTAVPWPQEMFA